MVKVYLGDGCQVAVCWRVCANRCEFRGAGSGSSDDGPLSVIRVRVSDVSDVADSSLVGAFRAYVVSREARSAKANPEPWAVHDEARGGDGEAASAGCQHPEMCRVWHLPVPFRRAERWENTRSDAWFGVVNG